MLVGRTAPGPPGNSKQEAPLPTEALSFVANAAAIIAAALKAAAHAPPPMTRIVVKENAFMLTNCACVAFWYARAGLGARDRQRERKPQRRLLVDLLKSSWFYNTARYR